MMQTPQLLPTGARAPSCADGSATLKLLWERVRRQGDMPGFARTIAAILGAVRGEDEDDFDMAQTMLTDPVLTQKVLRLANSSMYSAFGQSINTVTRAIMVIGTEAIGHLAMGLKLVEELSSNIDDPTGAHIEMEKAVLSGMVAHQVALGAAVPAPEEAVVCSMLHALGRMMVAFYMPEAWQRMGALAGTAGMDDGDEDAAALPVLGLTIEQIGRAAAENWGLPANLIGGMRRIGAGSSDQKLHDADWLSAVSTMSSQCAEALWHDDAAGLQKVNDLVHGFSAMLGLAPEVLLLSIEKAKIAASTDLTIAPLSKPAERRARSLASSRRRDAGHKVLGAGVADMRDFVNAATPGQMMSMALETVYQGLSFSRACAFMRSPREQRYVAKMGFGAGVRELLPLMQFDDRYEANVFHAALSNDRVIFIENARDPKFAAKLPLWWKDSLREASSFVILPVCSDGKPVGFIYGDWDASYPDIALNETEFGLLNNVRALVARCVDRRRQIELVAAKNQLN
ncbi:HDOD domain-containing protein [Massilia sp. PWRC2]|uniref:HDOD domain-containing protein n=1 Tax=Massilia sp. PWRC2 TaxID=2804626 RepID=UPI003CF47D85